MAACGSNPCESGKCYNTGTDTCYWPSQGETCPAIPACPTPESPDAGDVTITISHIGEGKVLSSGGDNQLAERDYITVPYGYKVYFQAEAAPGYAFQKFTGTGGETTSSYFEVEATTNGYVTAAFISESAGSCPKGDYYSRPLFGDCDPGYHPNISGIGGLVGGMCYCDSSEKAAEAEKREQEGVGGLGSLLSMLPTLIIFLVIASIIGAFRR